MTKGIQGGSILDLVGRDEKARLGIDEQSLGLSLSFKRGRKNPYSVDFCELPYMGQDSGDIYHNLTRGVNAKLMSEGLTNIFVNTRGSTQVHVNGKPRSDDRFSNAILNQNLCTGFDITSRVEQLKEELNEIRGVPLHVHEMVCRSILWEFLDNAKKCDYPVTSADDVLFTFRCPGSNKNLTPVKPNMPFVVVPVPLANGLMDYEFFVSWIRVFNSGYRTIISHCFYEMVQEAFGENEEFMPHTFNLPSTRGFEQ